jgi:hypothetical protein
MIIMSTWMPSLLVFHGALLPQIDMYLEELNVRENVLIIVTVSLLQHE